MLERLQGWCQGREVEGVKLGCPHTFPVRCQILCGNQSPICLKAAGAGKVPISDVRVRVGVVEESGLQAGGPWGRFGPWMGGGLGGLQLSRPFHRSGCGAAGRGLVKRSSLRAAVAVRRVQTALPAASISHPLGSADTVNGPEIECKIKMQQINGCKSHLEPIIRTTSGLQSCETSAEAKLAWLRGGRGGGTPAPHPPLAQLSSH